LGGSAKAENYGSNKKAENPTKDEQRDYKWNCVQSELEDIEAVKEKCNHTQNDSLHQDSDKAKNHCRREEFKNAHGSDEKVKQILFPDVFKERDRYRLLRTVEKFPENDGAKQNGNNIYAVQIQMLEIDRKKTPDHQFQNRPEENIHEARK
jgi:hypothetical protein